MNSITSISLIFKHVPFPQEIPICSQSDRLGDGDGEGVGENAIDVGSGVISGIVDVAVTPCAIGKKSTMVLDIESIN